jgi:hypothetical protein
VLGSGYVLGVGSIEGLQHLNAKACIAREEDSELENQLPLCCFLKSQGLTSFPHRQTPCR